MSERQTTPAVARKACTLMLVGLLTATCDRSSQTPTNDTTGLQGSPQADSLTGETRNAGWDERLGPVLFIAGASPSDALVVQPYETEASGGHSGSLDAGTVISRDGRTARVRILGVVPHTDSLCVAWPTSAVRDSSGAALPSWSIGFAGADVTAIRMDSVEAFARGDSTRTAADLARLASALPDDTLPSFRGLPFVVREMRRFRPAAEVETVVTDIARRLATEANPREERLFLIAERVAGGAWRAAYWSRASGPEDTVESGDALATVRFADGRVGMVVALETGSSIRYVLIFRDAGGKWRSQWRSAETDC